MSIIRAPRPQTRYYVLDKRISEDKRLTWEARGLLVYLLGKPDHWKVSTHALINETVGTRKHSGRDSVRAILGELMSAGYMVRIVARAEQGKVAGYDYIVSERPGTDSPATDQPGPVNPPLVSNDVVVSNETPSASPAGDADRAAGFDAFWNAYPKMERKVAKAECLKRWKKRNLASLADQIVSHVTKMAQTKSWQDGYAPAPLTYINQSRWEDAEESQGEDFMEGAL